LILPALHLLTITLLFFFYSSPDHRDLHSFPTRRSSDLESLGRRLLRAVARRDVVVHQLQEFLGERRPFQDRDLATIHEHGRLGLDRKSTRLNSSHRTISYAVFCLKKKKKTKTTLSTHQN